MAKRLPHQGLFDNSGHLDFTLGTLTSTRFASVKCGDISEVVVSINVASCARTGLITQYFQHLNSNCREQSFQSSSVSMH